MTDRRCAVRWAGQDCQHECARPPGHPGLCDCYCGTWCGQPDSSYAATYHRLLAAAVMREQS
jgi:hypothetical protein